MRANFLFFLARSVAAVLVLAGGGTGFDARAADGASLLAGQSGTWVNISDRLLADFASRETAPVIKFAYDRTNGAGVCGILADRSLSSPLVNLEGQGLWQPQAGAGSFQRVDGGNYDAFWENAGPDIDPDGRGLCLFSIQGRKTSTSCALTRDGGKTWHALTTDNAAFGYDVGTVDWSASGPMTILAKKHHNGDLVLSHDNGQTWTEIAPAQNRCVALGLLGPDVLLTGMSGAGAISGLFRSTDAGGTWTKVADCTFGRLGHVVVFKGTAWLTTKQGILTSQDKGLHWTLTGGEYEGLLGPVMFGEDEKHLVVYGSKGFSESKDGGKSWALAVPFGDDAAMRSGRFEYGVWDPKTDSFYITHISGRAYVYKRG